VSAQLNAPIALPVGVGEVYW